MSEAGESVRISIAVTRGVTGALFGLAIITYIIHAYIRCRINKQFLTEDALLLFAVICLCSLTGVAFAGIQGYYDSIQVILNSNIDLLLLRNTLDDLPRISKLTNVAATLLCFVIFPVKMSYLFFFRRLIVRLRILKIWWWCVVMFTIPAGLTCVAVLWLVCPYFTIQGAMSCADPSASYRTIRIASIVVVLDVVTDILVVSFPIALLWKVRISLRQKLGLALFLCLSLVMAVVAIVRIAGIKLSNGSIDLVWLAFWQQQECSIAVIMVSTSAFRSFFVAKGSTAKGQRPSPGGYSPSSWKRRLLRRRQLNDTESANGLPQIPHATLTGMRTAIRDIQVSTVSVAEEDLKG